ncbi:MAG: PSD1 and planctomycete cytochrome C domain-containing protein [Pirellulaceae bacterium]
MPRRALLAAIFLLLAGEGISAAEPPDFNRDVAPILIDHCLVCHQPDKKSGELDFTSRRTTLAGGDLGPALAAGKPGESLLLARIADGEMPPSDAKEARPLTDGQIATLRAWIAAGAPWPDDRELGIHEQSVDLAQARTFWSFQPVHRPAIPDLRTPRSEFRTPIDAFIQQKLAAAGLSLSPPATRSQLLRRLSLDLRGLPPTLDEQAAFENDAAPDAYERLVDRLLADPAYGERWTRHWLDLVRYADSNGYERDQPKPSVWRYRDYVIAALNGDKPYDRFVVEQIAGDELPNASHETLIATGFHALGAWQDEVDPLEAPQYRADELDDMVRTTSQTFLGLTLGCARCHNHKFDPLTMVDYYSFVAILAPLKRPNKGRTDRDIPLGTPEQIAAIDARNEALAKLDSQIQEITEQKPAGAEQQMAAIRAQQHQLRAETPDLPGAYRCYEENSESPPTFLLLSGRASNPGPRMQPRVPAVLTHRQPDFFEPRVPNPDSRSPSSSRRRLNFARWLASRDNPLTARVIVNRVWQHHFGTGIVATSSDFGQMGARPTHPKLLDWLAHWFMHDAEWSVKDLHRLMVTSGTYRQSSLVPGSKFQVQSSTTGNLKPGTLNSEIADPENHLLWHFPYRRLDVEAIRDSALAVAGNLNRTMYGPAVFLPIPAAAIEAHTDKQAAWSPSAEPDIDRRTVYAFIKRTLLVPMLETLDFCDTTNSTPRRSITSVAPQALTLYNGQFMNRQAEQFAQRLVRESGDDRRRQIELAYRLALARLPTADESAAIETFLDQETAATDAPRALVQLCRVILNLNEFVYPN